MSDSLNKLATTAYTGSPVKSNLSGLWDRVRHSFDDYASFLADTETYTVFTADDIVSAGQFLYEIALSGASDHDGTTAGGVKYYVLPNVDGSYSGEAVGAVGDKTTDNTPAVQVLFDKIASTAATSERSGGTIVFGNGLFGFAGTLVPKSENIRIVGNGKRNPQSSLDQSDTDVPATLFKTGTGPLIDLDTQYRINGFSTENITLLGQTADKANITAIRWHINSADFRRNFTFRNTTIEVFDAAFNVHRDAGAAESAIGVVVVETCNVMHNNHIWTQTGVTNQINSFKFLNNDAGQNTVSGISLRGHIVEIRGNVLEGQPNPIAVGAGDAFRSMIIEGNYFELNTGTACIDVTAVGIGIIGPNYYEIVDTDYKVRAEGTFGMTFHDPVIVRSAIMPRLLPYRSYGTAYEGTLNYPTDAAVGNSRIVEASEEQLNKKPDLLYSTRSFTRNTREEWIDGNMIQAEELTTSGTGLYSLLFSTASASVGEWVVVTIPVKYVDAPTALSMAMRINDSGSDANGSVDGSWAYFSHVPADEWMLITFAVRARVTVTSHMVYFYPFGPSPAAGLVSRILNPSLHIMSEPEFIKPSVDLKYAQSYISAPTAGTWNRGDRIFNNQPSAGGKEGYVCVSSGTPGTWKPYGAIDA